MRITLSVNGERQEHEVEPRLLLVHYLREVLGLTGTHIGCDSSNCGACTVMIDGGSAKSCTVLTVQCDGTEVTTVEGLQLDGRMHPVQEGFWRKHGLQCGYCTPGMLMSGAALLVRNPDPSEADVREAIEGNLCRCTGYQKIVESIQWAAAHPEGQAPAFDAIGGTPSEFDQAAFAPAYVKSEEEEERAK